MLIKYRAYVIDGNEMDRLEGTPTESLFDLISNMDPNDPDNSINASCVEFSLPETMTLDDAGIYAAGMFALAGWVVVGDDVHFATWKHES